MASGKTEVGREVASRLGWHFVDIDHCLEREFEMPVPEIFTKWGEPAFREAEARLASVSLERDRVVVSPGGGWAAQAMDRLGRVPLGTLSIWLRTRPETAVRRLDSEPQGVVRRPLLAAPGLLDTLREFAATRLPFYAQADHAIDTDELTVSELAAKIVSFTGPAYDGEHMGPATEGSPRKGM